MPQTAFMIPRHIPMVKLRRWPTRSMVRIAPNPERKPLIIMRPMHTMRIQTTHSKHPIRCPPPWFQAHRLSQLLEASNPTSVPPPFMKSVMPMVAFKGVYTLPLLWSISRGGERHYPFRSDPLRYLSSRAGCVYVVSPRSPTPLCTPPSLFLILDVFVTYLTTAARMCRSFKNLPLPLTSAVL